MASPTISATAVDYGVTPEFGQDYVQTLHPTLSSLSPVDSQRLRLEEDEIVFVKQGKLRQRFDDPSPSSRNLLGSSTLFRDPHHLGRSSTMFTPKDWSHGSEERTNSFPKKRARAESTYLSVDFAALPESKSQKRTPSPVTNVAIFPSSGVSDWPAQPRRHESPSIVGNEISFWNNSQELITAGDVKRDETLIRQQRVWNTSNHESDLHTYYDDVRSMPIDQLRQQANRKGYLGSYENAIDLSDSEYSGDADLEADSSIEPSEKQAYARMQNTSYSRHSGSSANNLLTGNVAATESWSTQDYGGVEWPGENILYFDELSNLNPARQIIDRNGNILHSLSPYVNDGWPIPGIGASQQLIRSYTDYVRHDPTKTQDEIKALLENIRPDMEIPPEDREGTPDAMVYPLMEHQKLGLAWLKQVEEGKNKGGVLADEQGLGKTIQALALIVSRKSTDPARKTTLIVAPVALLKQWEREAHKKLKSGHQLSVCVHHGTTKKAKVFTDLAKYDVVLTTFGTLATEYKRKEKYQIDRESNPNLPTPTLLFLGEQSKFYRVILDEAQFIKNRETQSSKGCYHIQATYRLCMSGTPMQNNCDELFSLLRFLRIRPYSDWSEFSTQFSRPLKSRIGDEASSAMKKLQALLKAILLRRTKTSMIDGKPILSLPPKHINMVYCMFSSDESDFYSKLETKSKIVYNKYLTANVIGKNYSNLLVLLLRLRQACCHPHLINDIAENDGDTHNLVVMARKLEPGVIARIISTGSQECPVCLDSVENPSIIVPCGHSFCSECLLQVQTQAEQAALGGGDENTKAKCPKCRGNLDLQKVITLKNFRRIYQPELIDEREHSGNIASESLDAGLIYDSDSDGGEQRSLDNLVARKSKGKQKEMAGRLGKTLAEVKKDATKNEKSKRQYQRFLSKRWIDSSKVTKTVEILDEIQTNSAGEKTIVFSQFTSLLDLVEIPLCRKRWEYRRYDGSMTATKRNQALVDFSDDSNVKILLVSLKAGNAGLNLVAASQVIMLDPFYNPFIEYQAIDRAHRIGQQRPVFVHRLIVSGTVEDRVLELQNRKKELIEGALDENASYGIGKLSAQELGFLFGVN